ncbi:MAG: hypothetical protein LIO75_05995 [Lachnospiraceae bacterium]|nr:hypothetical protein [Lachnospiraceae bacterium]
MVMVLIVCKIIGVVLLVLAAAVAALLFCPVRYELILDIDRRRCSVRVSWLLHLIRFHFLFEEKAELVLSVLLFRLDFLDEEQKEKRQKRKQRRSDKKAAKKKKEADTGDTDAFSRKEKHRVLAFAQSAFRILSLVREYDIIETVWPGLQRFLFRIRPRRLTGRVEFGLADPSQTGQIIGALSLIPLFYQTDFKIFPDFDTEQAYIRGNIYAKGRLQMVYAVIWLAGLARQRNVRIFFSELRHRSNRR